MKRIESVLIAGAGGIGSSVAWQIERALPGAVSVLAGGERLARYRELGFLINGERFDLRLEEAGSGKKFDLVIVACKGHHLPQVIEDLASHVGQETLLLSLLNGISSEAELSTAFGAWRIPYAMIVGTDAWHSGNETRFSKTGTIFFGDAENETAPSERVALIADFFSRTSIRHEIPRDMLNRLWYKFMMNVGINQVTAIIRAPYRALKTATAIPEAVRLVNAAMREVIEVAKKEGIELGERDIETVYATLDTLSDWGKTSMCQDVEAGRQTEVELFAGTVITLARRHGVSVPVNETFYDALSALYKVSRDTDSTR